jgi:hypothetical protein
MVGDSLISAEELTSLSYDEKVALASWQQERTGRDGFVPAAVRRLPLASRQRLAYSEETTIAWEQRERHRVSRDVFYFIVQYGSIEPPKGKPTPFELWVAQRAALELLTSERRVYFLKARRLGLSWLVLHYALWLLGYAEGEENSRILVLSKNQSDAGKLLQRVKRINDRLPLFLRAPTTGADSTTTFALRSGEIMVLPATEGAARQETARAVILDEFGFPKNGVAGPIWTAVQPTIEGGGQLFVVSTGNGETGDGATFAQIWKEAQAGSSDGVAVFLPWHARPDRTEEWRERERKNYESDEAFNAEYPETPEQALAGDRSIKVYPLAGINAAERIGRELWDSAGMRALTEEGVEIGTDWGDFQTFTTYALPLPGGGIYVIDELVQPHVEPQRAAWNILRHDPGALRARDGGKLHAVASRADSAPAGTNSTFVAVLEAAWQDEDLRNRIPESHTRVAFSKYKQGGNETRGVNTVAFLKWLFRRSAEWVAGDGTIDELHGVIAIHPRCRLLLAQLRNLERDPDDGKVIKPSLDPKHPERGDHGADSLIPTASVRAIEWTAQKESDE